MRLRRGTPPQPGAGEEMLERCWMLEMLEASDWGTNTEDGERSRGRPHRGEAQERGAAETAQGEGWGKRARVFFCRSQIASPTPCKLDQLW